MKAFSKKIILTVVTIAGGAMFQTSAMAACDLNSGGFIAAAIECVAPAPVGQAARVADRIHGQIGSPLDTIAHNTVNRAIPRFEQPGGAFGGNTLLPAPGNFCYTPIGRFGPGQPMPVGAPCHIITPHGPVIGNIGN